MKVSIIMPYRLDRSYRERIYKWVRRRYELLFPDFELCMVEDKEQTFHKTKAVNLAASRASGHVLVQADADIFFAPRLLRQATQLILDGKYQWVMPYREYWPLTTRFSADILRQPSDYDVSRITTRHVKYVIKGSPAGLIAISKQAFMDLGGLDERFVGWGCEDTAFYTTANSLLHPAVRLPGKIYHHWHPRARQQSTVEGTLERNAELRSQYALAASRGQLKSLIEGRLDNAKRH